MSLPTMVSLAVTPVIYKSCIFYPLAYDNPKVIAATISLTVF